MIANVLNAILPQIHLGVDVVSREQVGMIPAVYVNSQATMAAVGQTINYPIVAQGALEDIVPGVTPPATGGQTVGNGTMTINNSKAYPIAFSAEESLAIMNGQISQYETVIRDSYAQAFRTITNAVEADLAALHVHGSRAYGTPGTAPFNTPNDFSDFAQLGVILDDNGAPSDRHLVLSNGGYGNMIAKQPTLISANTTGDPTILRSGLIVNNLGFGIHKSGQINSFTAGSAASATTNAAGYAAGATVITLASAGTGAVKNGDVIQFAGDNNKYGVVSGDTDVSNGGTITLAGPGLRQAIPAAATAITVVGSAVRNMAFSRNAIHLIARAPASIPGETVVDRTYVTDPVSGLIFELSVYGLYRAVRWEVALAWGVKAAKPDHMATLLG